MQNRLFTSLILVICTVFVSCQETRTDLGERTSFEISSTHTGTTYQIQVRLPLNHNPSDSYSTIYVLDGDWYFHHASEKSARLSEEAGKRNAIVVGVGHGNDRTTDYMPTSTKEGEGGAPDFTKFLQEELIPYMEANFSSDPSRGSRVILGHSAGGLYSAYVFTRHNHLFGNYLMLSPAVWYDEGVILEYESETRNENASSENVAFVSRAELDPTQLFMKMFHDRLQDHYLNTDLMFHTVKGKKHTSSANPAISEGLSFYFNLKQDF